MLIQTCPRCSGALHCQWTARADENGLTLTSRFVCGICPYQVPPLVGEELVRPAEPPPGATGVEF